MAKPNAGLLTRPFSLKAFREFMNDPKELAQMAPMLAGDYFFKAYDFQEATLNPDWTAVKTSGGTETNFAFNAQRNGALRGATGTDQNNVVGLHYHSAIFDAADNPFMMARLKLPAALSSYVMEIGFSDPKSTESAVSISDIDTPAEANGVTDGALLAMDTSQTLVTPALVGFGTTPATAKTNITDRAGTVWTPTVSKWVEILVHVRENIAYCDIWQDNGPVGRFSVASGPDASVLMRPSLLFKTLNTTTKQIDIDQIIVGAERNAA